MGKRRKKIEFTTKMKFIFVGSLVFILLFVCGYGTYKSEKIIEENKKIANEINQKMEEERRIQKESEERIKSSLPNVYCWGDSLTAGAGGEGITYPNVLAKLTNLKVFNYGVGGETAQSIAMRQGALPIYVENVIIPSEIKDIEVQLYDSNDDRIALLKQGDAGINPCILDGIQGVLSYNKDEDKYYFRRSNSGDEKEVSSGTQLITSSMNNKNSSNDILVVFSGSNNPRDIDNIYQILETQRKMIDYADTDKYVIIGLTTTNVEEFNKILEDEYGEHFLDIKKYLVNADLESLGITPTEQDIIDIDNGEVPSSLRIDSIHGTANFYKIIGEELYKKILDLEYLNDEQKEYLGI